MFKLLPLLLALSASAGESPLVLKTLHTLPKGVTDPGYTIIATPTRASVNLWSLDSGRQTGQIMIPDIEDKHESDLHTVFIHAVRPDLKVIVVGISHLFYNRRYDSDRSQPQYTSAVSRTYLASTEDEKNIKMIWTMDSRCVALGGMASYRCGGVRNEGEVSISPSRPEVRVNPQFGGVDQSFDLNGKKVSRSTKDPEELKTTSDDQSCSVLRGEKRVSFLENCSKDDILDLSADGKTVTAPYGTAFGRPYKAWDAASGSLTTLLEPTVPSQWRAKYWSLSVGGRLASLLLKKEDGSNPEPEDREIQIWSTASGKLLAVGSGSTFSGMESFQLLPDGHRGLYEKGKSMVVVDLGLEGSHSAPVVAGTPKVDVDAVPAIAAKTVPDAFAVVIGIEKYRQAGVPAVDYASRDAKTMAAYLGAMGFDPKNVAVLTDAQAGKVDFDKHFGKWLKNRVGPKSRVFVYYAGHGAPNPTTGAGYLMPYEADPSYLDETAYPVTQLYAELAKLPTKDVTVVLDACFSGQGERSLFAKGTRPLVPLQKTRGPENAAVIAAASGSQISASDHEARHGLLTYHLLAGLHGGADENGDGKITTAELFAYARPAVERAAKLQNVEQTPTVSGETGAAGMRVWVSVPKR